MPTLHGVSDGTEVARDLEVEDRGAEVLLSVHPPGNTGSGQDILVPRESLLGAVRAGEGRISGVSPVQRTPKECVIERRPEGLRIQVHPASGLGSWWVVVRPVELEAALA